VIVIVFFVHPKNPSQAGELKIQILKSKYEFIFYSSSRLKSGARKLKASRLTFYREKNGPQ
jgi:hypothetical protein